MMEMVFIHLRAAVLVIIAARGLDHGAASPLQAHVEDGSKAAAGCRRGAVRGVVTLDGDGAGAG